LERRRGKARLQKMILGAEVDIKVFYAVVNKSRVDLIRSRASNQVRDKTRSTVGKIAYWHKNFLPRKTLNYI